MQTNWPEELYGSVRYQHDIASLRVGDAKFVQIIKKLLNSLSSKLGEELGSFQPAVFNRDDNI